MTMRGNAITIALRALALQIRNRVARLKKFVQTAGAFWPRKGADLVRIGVLADLSRLLGTETKIFQVRRSGIDNLVGHFAPTGRARNDVERAKRILFIAET